MDWTDFFPGGSGDAGLPFDASNFSGFDPTGGFNTGGSDWATGNPTGPIEGLPNGGGGLINQIQSLLGSGKNIPTSLLKSLLGTGDAQSAGLAKLLGTGVGGLLDYKSTQEKNEFLKKQFDAGQPYRDRANAAMQPGFDINSIPGYKASMDTAAETYLRKLSATGGNPAGIGAAPSQTQAYLMGNVGMPAWQNYFNSNSNAGGLSNLATGSFNGLSQNAGAEYGSLGATANKMMNSDSETDYRKIMRSMYGLA